MLLGCIGDDFTGSSDIANTLAKGGMSVTQFNGVPNKPAHASVEAGVVALKSRTAPIKEAVADSLRAAEWLLDQGCEQIFFKYCSTFDSTKEGNIGPVAEALAERLGQKSVIFCPAFPAAGRSIYQGNLFVGDVPLSESSLKDHPLTPMTDADLRRWLKYQTKIPVKHLPFSIVNQGYSSIQHFLEREGAGFYIADAIEDQNLIQLGKVAKAHKLLTGGSGLALGLPDNFRKQGKIEDHKSDWTGIKGPGIILSGSCSAATRKQVSVYSQKFPTFEVTAESILDGRHTANRVCDWVMRQRSIPLVYTSADPDVVRLAQKSFGQEFVAGEIEQFFGSLAIECVKRGTKRIVSAGGETSGAIVTALNMAALEIGPEIAPGVPALKDVDHDLAVALKSGNFGGDTFFEEALEILAR